jgi:tape measure domain-containing protein
MANDVADLLLKIDATTEGLRRELKRAEASVSSGTQVIDKQTKKISQSFDAVSQTAKRLAVTLAAAFGIREIIAYGDAWQNTANQLKTVQKDGESLSKTQEKLMGVANQTRSGFESTVGLYTRLSRATESLNLSQEETIALTTTINKSFTVSGATAQEASNAITQLAQGLSAGALRGDEFNSVSEQSPILMQAIADSLKMTRGELRNFAAEGGITSEIVVRALQEASGEIDETFSKMSSTFGQNMQVAKNNMLGFVGSSDSLRLAMSAIGSGIVLLSDHIEIVTTTLASMGAAFVVLTAPAAIVGGINMIKNAALALNAAFLANPIAMIVAAMAAAAVVIYRHWDEITVAAEKSAVHVEIAWNKLKLFLLDSFAPALDTISGLFADVQDNAMATWSAIAAAAKDPLNAIDTFNSTFDDTLERLRNGRSGSDTFADSVQSTKDRIVALEGKLAGMNTTVETVDESVGDADFSLSQFKTNVDETTEATGELDAKALELVGTLSNEVEAFGLSNLELAIRNNLQKAGVTATSELGQEIIALTTEIHNEKEAMTAAATEAKALEKANDEAARAAEEAWGRTHDYLSTTFIDIFNNGKNAFQNIADSFTAMIKRMVAEWAASKIMNLIGFGGTTSSGAGNPISSILSGAGSSILSGGGSAAGGGILAGAGSAITGAASSIAGGVASAGSAAMGALSAIPGWGWALGGAAVLAKVLDSGGTMSNNAGMLTQNLGHAGSFDIPPFASGAEFTGFARRSDQKTATDNIDAFREVDAYLTNVYTEMFGKAPNLKASDFIGYDENGMGKGAFFGSASEDGGSSGAAIEDQLTKFTKRWIELAGAESGTSQDAINSINSSGSFADILATTGALIDGSHRSGLKRVPFDGYVAELHKNEEVLTENDPRNSNNGMGSMGMMNEMRKIAESVKKTADLLTRVTRDGNSLVTEPA